MKKASHLVRHLTVLLLVLVLTQLSHAKGDLIQTSKTAKILLALDGEGALDLQAKNTTVTIETWEKNQVEIVAEVIYKGEENDKIIQFLDEFEDHVKNLIYQSGNSIEISSDLETPKKVQIGGKLIGVQIDYSSKELDLRYNLKVPSNLRMEIECSYRDLMVKGNFSRKVKIDHYNGQLSGGNFDELELELKYGEANLGSIKNLEATLYEEELRSNSMETAEIEAKYSEIINTSYINLLIADFYETDLESESIESLKGSLKYSKFQETQHMQKVELSSIYETDFEVSQIGTFQAEESKYCKLLAGKINYLQLPASYEDKIETRSLNSADLEQPKYLKLEIDLLGEYLNINEGYETDITIEELTAEARKIFIEGKYMKLYLNARESNLMLDVDAKYANIEFDEALLDRKVYIKENDQIQMKAETKNKSGNQTSVIIRGYEFETVLK